MKVPFTKMHGLGNDFIVVDCIETDIPTKEAFAKTYCERRFGVGADQLIVLEKSDTADFKMRIFNRDGSEVEMCGNGIRCLAKFISDNDLSAKKTLRIETLAGIISPEIIEDKIKVDMGSPILLPKDIPVKFDGSEIVDVPFGFGSNIISITAVSMGNPHCVLFVDDFDQYDIAKLGAEIEVSEYFPNRTNVEFVKIVDQSHIDVKVWERGAGLTMACGTGACACAVASILNKKTKNTVTVSLPGGDLLIEWSVGQSVFMTGPAEKVYKGTILI